MITGYNPLDLMIMDSDEKANYMIKEFIAEYDKGRDINDSLVQNLIFDRLGFDFSSLMESDKQRVIREVEQYARFN